MILLHFVNGKTWLIPYNRVALISREKDEKYWKLRLVGWDNSSDDLLLEWVINPRD